MTNEIVGYPGKDGALNNLRGDRIGTCKVVARWRRQSYVSSYLYQIEATVDGIVYTGRGAGENMLYRGKRKAQQS